jgi:hypothetical protein
MDQEQVREQPRKEDRMGFRIITAAVVGAVLGALVTVLVVERSIPGHAAPVPATIGAEVALLKTEVERLKKIVPDQAHAMMDVDYHFTNLWFAAKAGNWALADFYWKETISHLRWAMRIIPVRKDSAGRDVKVQSILEGIENSPLMGVGDAIKAKDQGGFEAKYKLFMEACYTCHTSAEKPYIRPQLPEQRTAGITNFDPAAMWPK